ncbi:MAG: alpha-galactosidase, partial [Eubacterium sp.]|nr:alpha-galactosidase [Eubacterium sp.]
MFKLESKNLKREFKVTEGALFASQITNTESGMHFIPDGNGSEFTVKFADGEEFSSKGLQVIESAEKNGRLFFRFKEVMGTSVTMSYRVSANNITIEKQLAIQQSTPKVIDYIALENIGIINANTSYTVQGGESEIDSFYSNLGQPFYIDSLFFGCEFPATKNIISHGRGQILYYIGKSVEDKLICPTTVMGGAKSNLLVDLRKSFFEYIESIALPAPIRFQYNTWYDRMMNIDANNIQKAFYNVERALSSHGVPPLDGYVIDDGWNNYKNSFWSFNQNKFPNGILDASHAAKSFGSEFGLWLGPRGGYNFNGKFGKRIEKGGFGYYNAEADEICVASQKYLDNLEKFFIQTTKENDIGYWKLDGFCLKPCKNEAHDHITGGDHDMYFVTEMWHRWIKIFRAMHTARAKQGKKLWINMTCYVNPSPWWLQYVNSIWLQNSGDIGFAENYPKGKQAQVDSALTYRDGRY